MYLACQNQCRNEFHEENVKLLAALTVEIEYLRSLGSKIIIPGDLNSWLGKEGEYGMALTEKKLIQMENYL